MTRSAAGRRLLRALMLVAVASTGLASDAQAQWSTSYEQLYLPGRFNWQFRHNYPAAERLFNAFDYGHAILYEKLWARPGSAIVELETVQYDFITRELLVHPPNVALEESAIEVAYAQLAPGGSLRAGSPADVVVIDPDTPWILDRDDLKSQCKNTPFDEARFSGRVVRTIVGGRTVYEHV